MARNNAGRTGAPTGDAETTPEAPTPPTTAGDALSFVTPTEFVELPSEGKYYPPEHPLHGQETVEIRLMTAKDEDIISSQALLKKGIAIDRLITNLMVDKRIELDSLLLGDKSAILMAARCSAYGADYTTRVTCPACTHVQQHEFDLTTVKTYRADDWGEFNISPSGNGGFTIELPRTQAKIEIRLSNGRDEKNLMQLSKKRKKYNMETGIYTETMKTLVVSVNGVNDRLKVTSFVENMPAFDARYLRAALARVTPGLDTKHDFVCDNCGYDTELEVPFTTDFFWPK